MKIGDQIVITYADGEKVVAYIVGETAKQWKIKIQRDIYNAPLDAKTEVEVKRVNKSMDIEVITSVKIETPLYGSIPDVVDDNADNGGGSGKKVTPVIKKKKEKTYSTRMWILIGFTLILATFAILVGLHQIELGEAGIKFLFLQ